MKKNHIVILSVVLSVLAAVGATILFLKHLTKKKSKDSIAPADLAFETDFEDFDDFEDLEDEDEEAVAQ